MLINAGVPSTPTDITRNCFSVLLAISQSQSIDGWSLPLSRPTNDSNLGEGWFEVDERKGGDTNNSSSNIDANGHKSSVKQQQQRPYDVAILAIHHNLVSYAEVVQERIRSLGNAAMGPRQPRPTPVSHIMVLTNVDHLTPCLLDLTNDGILFAVILNGANYTHNSCTLRILHSSTQQGWLFFLSHLHFSMLIQFKFV